MLEYPSVPRSTGQEFREFDAYLFDKLDGSNLRFGYSKKQGWHKFGTRRSMFNETDPLFGRAIPLFKETLSEPLTELARKHNWKSCTVFAEFWGKSTLGGRQTDKDSRVLTVFDIAVENLGLLDPREFMNIAYSSRIAVDNLPRMLGRVRWTRGFVEKVYNGEVDGITHEGVVGKAVEGRELILAKAKTKAWIDSIKEMYKEDEKMVERLLNS